MNVIKKMCQWIGIRKVRKSISEEDAKWLDTVAAHPPEADEEESPATCPYCEDEIDVVLGCDCPSSCLIAIRDDSLERFYGVAQVTPRERDAMTNIFDSNGIHYYDEEVGSSYNSLEEFVTVLNESQDCADEAINQVEEDLRIEQVSNSPETIGDLIKRQLVDD
jgi:hypothetical protein